MTSDVGNDVPMLKIYLRSDDDTGYLLDATEIHNLVVDDLDHVERISRRDRIDKDIAMYSDRVLGIQYRELILGIRSEVELRRRYVVMLTWPAVSMMSQS